MVLGYSAMHESRNNRSRSSRTCASLSENHSSAMAWIAKTSSRSVGAYVPLGPLPLFSSAHTRETHSKKKENESE